MKKRLQARLIGMILTSFCLVMCSKHEPMNSIQDSGAKMEASFLLGCNTAESPAARLVINFLDFSIIEIYDPENTDVLSYHFMDSHTGESLLLMVSEENVVITGYDPLTGKKGDEALISSAATGFERLILSKVDWEKGTFQTKASVDLPDLPQTKARADDLTDDIREIFVKHLDEFSEKVSDLGSTISFLGPIAEGAGALCDMYTNFIIPSLKVALYQDEPEKQEEILKGNIRSMAFGFVADRLKFKGITGSQHMFIIKKSGETGKDLGETLGRHLKGYFDDEEEQEYYLSSASYSVNKSMPAVNSTQYNEKKAFSLSVSVSDVSETSAILSGDYRLNSSTGGHYSSMGFCWHEMGATEKTITSDQLQPVSINRLEKATTYIAMSYVQTIFETYYSVPVAFTTKGIKFEVSESSLTFTKEGGSAKIGITVGENSEWELTSHPDWCQTGIDGNTLTVTVKESKKERVGEIVLTCTNIYGESESRTISISQILVNWNNTAWTFSGDVTYSSSFAGEHISGSAPFEYMFIEIFDCEKGEFNVDMEGGSSYRHQIRVDENGNLVLEQSIDESFQVGRLKGTIEYIFTRTGTDTATGTISGRLSSNVQDFGNMVIDIDGNLNGKRKED